MVADACWQELCRFDDLMLARAVATSIAAMEFDVCLCAAGDPHAAGDDDGRVDDGADPLRPPYVVQVSPGSWHQLAAVLDEIIDEQQEFDRQVAQHQATSRRAHIVAVISLAGVGELILHLAGHDW